MPTTTYADAVRQGRELAAQLRAHKRLDANLGRWAGALGQELAARLESDPEPLSDATVAALASLGRLIQTATTR